MPPPDDYIYPSEEILSEIGQVAFQWSWLEEMVAMGIAYLLGLNPHANASDNRKIRALVTHLGIGLRLDMFMALARDRIANKPKINELKKICGEIKNEVAGKRNNVVHGIWVGSDEANKSWRITFKARGELKGEEKDFTPEDINKISQEIVDVRHKLFTFLTKNRIVPWQ